jgi:predicted ATPase
LTQCANLRILTTSREALGITGETTLQVPGLSFPVLAHLSQLQNLKEFESIQLFAERAAAAHPELSLTQANAFAVTQICHRLDGIPLALELAAARVKILSLEEIAQRLDDRFALLTQGSRTALPRHQTLRALIEWSYDLLSQPERIFFSRLSVFAGGFTLDAAEEVAAGGDVSMSQVTDLLGQLINKSLVTIQTRIGDAEPATRYGMLETIREFAREKLEASGEADITRDRHLDFFMKLAEEAELHHFSSEQLVWFDRVQTEIDNMRTAMDWSIADGHTTDSKNGAWRQETGLRAIGALVWFWHRSYARETSERLKQMLTITDKPTVGRARALYSLGFLYWTVNNFSEARKFLEEALTISRKLDDRLTLARSLGYLGAVAATEGNYILAQSLLEESLSVARELGPAGRKAASWALAFLGDVHFTQGDYLGSKKLYEEAVALTKEAHEKNMLGLMIRRLGYIALRQLDQTGATEYFKESLKSNQEVGHAVGICASLTAFANLALAQGKFSQAAQIYGAVESYLDHLSSPLFYSDKIEYQLGVSSLLNQLGSVALEEAWTKGAKMTLDEAIAFAQEQT